MATVLIIEDEPSTREGMEIFLNLSGHNALVPSTKDEAMQLIRNTDIEIDAIIMDRDYQGPGWGKSNAGYFAQDILEKRPNAVLAEMSTGTGSEKEFKQWFGRDIPGITKSGKGIIRFLADSGFRATRTFESRVQSSSLLEGRGQGKGFGSVNRIQPDFIQPVSRVIRKF